MNTTTATRWQELFKRMESGETIEVSDWDFPEATRFMPQGFTARQIPLANGNVHCTITRKRRSR